VDSLDGGRGEVHQMGKKDESFRTRSESRLSWTERLGYQRGKITHSTDRTIQQGTNRQEGKVSGRRGKKLLQLTV